MNPNVAITYPVTVQHLSSKNGFIFFSLLANVTYFMSAPEVEKPLFCTGANGSMQELLLSSKLGTAGKLGT